VTAEHHHYAALETVGIYYRGDYPPEITGNENVGQRIEKCAKAQVVPRGRRELFRSNLVRAALDRNGADLRQVRFFGYSRVVLPVGGVYDFR